MIRKLTGLSLMATGFALKSTLIHNIEYWGTVRTWSPILTVVGLIVLLYPLIDWIEDSEPRSFLHYPFDWIVFFGKVLFSVILLAAIGIGVEASGTTLNEKIKGYYLSKEIGVTKGIIVGETKESFTTFRYRFNIKTIKEKFLILEYWTEDGVIRQGIESNSSSNKIGQTVSVYYSIKYPTFFQIK